MDRRDKMQPMRISASTERGFVRRTFRNRFVVFLVGVAAALFLALLFGLNLKNLHSDEASAQQYGILLRLDEGERYYYVYDQQLTVTTEFGDEKLSTKNKAVHSEYSIERLCAERKHVLMRMRVENFTVNPEFLESLKFLSDAVLDPKGVTATADLRQFNQWLSTWLTGLTFSAQMTYDGQVMRKFTENIDSTLNHALSYFLLTNAKSLEKSQEDGGNALRGILWTDAMHLAEEVQDGLLPFLAIPPKENKAVGDSWTRLFSVSDVPFTSRHFEVNYTLVKQHMKCAPAINKGDWENLVDDKTCPPLPIPASLVGLFARHMEHWNITNHDQAYHIIRMQAVHNDNRTASELLDLQHTLNVKSATVTVRLNGVAVIGMQSGMVYEAYVETTHAATITATKRPWDLAPIDSITGGIHAPDDDLASTAGVDPNAIDGSHAEEDTDSMENVGELPNGLSVREVRLLEDSDTFTIRVEAFSTAEVSGSLYQVAVGRR